MLWVGFFNVYMKPQKISSKMGREAEANRRIKGTCYLTKYILRVKPHLILKNI